MTFFFFNCCNNMKSYNYGHSYNYGLIDFVVSPRRDNKDNVTSLLNKEIFFGLTCRENIHLK